MQEPLNMHHLFVFYALARAGSFTRAADELFITQPAVSKQVRQLETELRADLVSQVGRRIFLTEAGALLAEYAATIFRTASDARRAMVELEDLQRGTVTIAASETIGMYLLPAVIHTFLEQYPRVSLRLDVMNTANVVDTVAAYAAELGFVEGPVERDDIRFDDLAADELVVVTSPDHPLGNADHVHPDLLSEVGFVLREAGSGTRAVADAFLDAAGVTPRVVAEIDNIEAMKRAVAAGLGCTVLSIAAVAGDVSAGTLVVHRLDQVHMSRPLRVATLRQRRLSRASQAFMAMVAVALPQLLIAHGP